MHGFIFSLLFILLQIFFLAGNDQMMVVVRNIYSSIQVLNCFYVDKGKNSVILFLFS